MVIRVISRTLEREDKAEKGQRLRARHLDFDPFKELQERKSSLLDVFQSTDIRSTRLESQYQLGHILLGHSVVGHREEVDDDQSKLVLVGTGHLIPISEDVEDRSFGLWVEERKGESDEAWFEGERVGGRR